MVVNTASLVLNPDGVCEDTVNIETLWSIVGFLVETATSIRVPVGSAPPVVSLKSVRR